MLKKGLPRHEQISNWLKEQIAANKYGVDEKLPSENDLSHKFDVSRVTVRRALQTLENEDLIYRSQGLGSFVSDRRSAQKLVGLTDFYEDMNRAGMKATSQVVQIERVEADEKLISRLKLKEGTPVFRLDRLRMGDGQPIAFDITWLPMFYWQLVEGHDLSKDTIYEILEEEFEIPVEKGCYHIEAENADGYLAEHLQVYPGQALLLIDRLSMTVGEKPIYYQKRYYRTDRIVYQLMVEREPGTSSSDSMPLKEFNTVFEKG